MCCAHRRVPLEQLPPDWRKGNRFWAVNRFKGSSRPIPVGRWNAWEYRCWMEEGLIGEIEDPFKAVKWQQVLGGEGLLPMNPLNSKDPHKIRPPQRIDHFFIRSTDRAEEQLRPVSSTISLKKSVVQIQGRLATTVSDHFGICVEIDVFGEAFPSRGSALTRPISSKSMIRPNRWRIGRTNRIFGNW
jgi:hypothetical protein